MLDKPKPPLKLADPLVYSWRHLHHSINSERKRARRAIRLLWAISMLFTVAIAVSMRWQPWFDIWWGFTPVAGVVANMGCWWFGIKMLFGKVEG